MTMQGGGKGTPPGGDLDALADGAVPAKKSAIADAIEEQLTPQNLVKEGVGFGAGMLGDKVEERIGKDTVKGKAAKAAVERVTKMVGSGLAALLPEARIDPVSYEVKVNGGPDLDWHVRRIRFEEAIAAPYQLMLELFTEETDGVFNVDELLGADLALEYGRNGVFRKVCGIIERVGTLGIAADRLLVRVHVVPALHALAQRVDTRIFQDLKVPEILKEVLEPALAEYGRKLDVSKLNDTYLPRDYCVQFKESDLDFCHRLMQEEGIAYFFEVVEGEAVETLVLADQNPAKPNEDYPEVESVIDDVVPIITDRPDTADTESIQRFEWTRPEVITKVTMRQFNWKRPDPSAPPESEKEEADARGRKREVYVPDDRRRIEDKGGDDGYAGTEVDEDEIPRTSKSFEALSVSRAYGNGGSNVTGFRAGGIFVIGDHPHPDVAEARLLLTRVVHHGECPEQEQGAGAVGTRYENEFECVPATTVYRPTAATSAKPKVYGAQTATVTGPAGEEIHTDAHGRIKVKFHWDRLSPLDQTSSCWVRVAQMWGGGGWGTWFLPRIGMEVVVQFLDGNPDRPLVVGCVYNGQNTPPYPLPEEKTKSTIKSNSSVGGGGFNEFRFEDLKGSEQVYLHAQKDHDEVVGNNHSRSVGSNETITISGNRSVTINGAPGSGESGDFKGHKVEIDGDQLLSTSQTIQQTAKNMIQLTVNPDAPTFAEILPKKITLQTAGGLSIVMDDESNTISLSTGKGATIDMVGPMIFLNCPG